MKIHISSVRKVLAVFAVLSLVVLVNSGSAQALLNLDGSINIPPKKYVALGDSVAAGLGMPFKATATAEDKACGRSAQAYSEYAVQRLKEPHTLTNVACAGATVSHLTNPQTAGGVTVAPQLDQAFANSKPDFITLTIGANDVHYSEFINRCINTTCDTPTNTTEIDALIAQLNIDLVAAMNTIQARSGANPPTVVLTGYYYPFSLTCPAVVPQLTLTEVIWINQQVDKVQSVIRNTASQYGFAMYAQPNFMLHELCSLLPWIQGPGEAAPLHPNYLGQTAISNAIIGRLYPLTLGF